MDNLDFNNLEYDLYELLELTRECSISDVKKNFRNTIKKFHPDKINQKEEEMYYNLTFANHVLSNEKLKNKYDKWLNQTNNSHNDFKNNFSSTNMSSYFPQNKKEASQSFIKDTKNLQNRHGNFLEDSRNFSERMNSKKTQRDEKFSITRENFRDQDEFNVTFDNKKKDGEFSDKIIKYENDKIVAYEHHRKGLKYVNLEDFNKLYVEDTVEAPTFTSLNRAFKLQPVIKNKKSNNINTEMNNYKNQTDKLSSINYDLNV